MKSIDPIKHLVLATLLVFCQLAWAQNSTYSFVRSKSSLQPSQVAVVVNEQFPGSLEVGEYYLHARDIPAKNLIRLSFPASSRVIGNDIFEQIRQDIDRQMDSSVRVVLFVWTMPYAVECNSITAAYSMGFQVGLCKHTCGSSRQNPYFNWQSDKADGDSPMKLSMLLPIESVEKAKALIDRGVESDGSWASAKAFFLKTSDATRNSRARFFPQSNELEEPPVSIITLEKDYIEFEKDIILYQTGAAKVPGLRSLQFLPGAIADHLTSTGGDLLGSRQMSSLRWLDAGATGSYGTVSEPCNHWQKFPNSVVLLGNYLMGSTLIEAYWRSVAWPGQGLFIGEPLAAPYRHHRLK